MQHYLVEYPGIEPGMVKTGGFTVHCITVDASTPRLGGPKGIRIPDLLRDRQAY
jgi:hypothetical protein